MTALVLIGLVSSIVGEITGTVSLRTVSIGRKVWWNGVGGGYVFAFGVDRRRRPAHRARLGALTT